MLNQGTITDITQRIARRQISAREVTQAWLSRIAKEDERLHASLHYNAEDALAQADRLDQAIAAGTSAATQPLLGVPIRIKDVLAVRNHPLNCGSRILGNFISPYDATAIE